MRLSVIVPVLDEERVIDARLRELAAIGAWEILVVDGGSRDATRAIVGRHPAARLVDAPRGRAAQMNAGAAVATGDVLWFVHADVALPGDARAHVERALSDAAVVGGAFRTWTVADRPTRLGPLLHLADLRSRTSTLPYGDQALFVRAPVFRAMLGVEHVYALIDRVTGHHGLDLVILTNATALDGGAHAGALERLLRTKVRFQVSIDGTSPEENDPIRGAGTFARASAGLALLSAMGFETALTLVPHRRNLGGLPGLPALARRLGAKSVHLMWGHRRGRGLAVAGDLPGAGELLPVARAVREAAREQGIRLDNVESLRLRVNALPNVKHDLGMAGVESVCLYTDGELYPSAATAGHAGLSIGRIDGRSIAEVWRASPIVRELREATLAKNPEAIADPLRFITGGGDLEHAYFWSGSFVGADPYAPLVSELARDVMVELARAGRARVNERSGFDAPVVFHAMGEGALACGDEVPGAVRTLHSNCVLAFEVDRPRALMRAFYGAAAETPQADLCCPVRPSEDDLAHIPKDVVDRFYGCGSPVRDAALAPGETHLDLGSGAGIDVFIAAKHVGPMGRAIGVDMTDARIAVANENRPLVARKLGYDVVSFCKGLLEEVPLPDAHVDCVTSNCVVNLSPDKRAVFSEIWRVLKDHGRLVLADIVAEGAVPPHLRVSPQLWGECLSGALTEAELLAELERAGFHGVEILARTFWRAVEGTTFHSITVRAYKHPIEKYATGAHEEPVSGEWITAQLTSSFGARVTGGGGQGYGLEMGNASFHRWGSFPRHAPRRRTPTPTELADLGYVNQRLRNPGGVHEPLRGEHRRRALPRRSQRLPRPRLLPGDARGRARRPP